MGLAIQEGAARAVLSDGWRGVLYPLGWHPTAGARDPMGEPLGEFPLSPQVSLAEALSPLLQTPVCSGHTLSAPELEQALSHLTGVIVSYSGLNSPEDRQVLEEAILANQWVKEPAQIYFLAESIAALLAILRPTGTVNLADFPGATLVIHATDWGTELALTTVQTDGQDTDPHLSFEQFWLSGFNYGQQALTQDVIRQLLYPLLPPEMMEHPPSSLGQLLIEPADRLQTVLQTQAQFTLRIGSQNHILQQVDLYRQVLLPYQSRLTQAIDTILTDSGIAAQDIQTIVCTGSLSDRYARFPWLQRKFPQVQILPQAFHTPKNTLGNIAEYDRIALGLASLPFYPSALTFAPENSPKSWESR